jgi:hypothetical protein
VQREGTEVGVALIALVERLGEREEPQPVEVAVRGIDRVPLVMVTLDDQEAA